MSWFEDLPVKRKLTLVILTTCTVVLLLACSALAIYEVLDFRRAMMRDTIVLASILGENAQAALAFNDADTARGLLGALKAEPQVEAVRLFNRAGEPFADYALAGVTSALPERPENDGERFADGHLLLFRPVMLDGKRIGTIHLRLGLGGMYERLGLFAGISGVVLLASLLLALVLSGRMQGLISRPILDLAATARIVAERKDYTVRALAQGGSELGVLTDAFNHMLAQIHAQNQALREGETRVRAVLDAAISAVVVIDAKGRIIDWNARAERLFGWTRSEVIGRELAATIIPARYRDGHRQGLGQFAATGTGAVLNRLVELSALRRDGGEFPVELSISPMTAGEVVTFCGFITDISERKRMEEMRVRLAAIVESSDDAILSETLDGIIISWNPGAEKLFGFPAQEVIGHSILLIIPPDRAHEDHEILAKIAKGENVEHFESVRVGKDGRRIEVSLTISPLRDEHGRIIGASKIARDITEQKQAAAKLQTQLARLDLLNRITRAIGERQDLQSIFQVVIRSLEDNLPIDFCCVCLYDATANTLTVANVGVQSEALAMALALPVQATIPIDQNGLSRCVAGRLVYEPDISDSRFPFPQRLAAGGLRSLVAAPLLVESQVFGVIIAARRKANGFNSDDCEFLRQLSEQVALAAHQAQLYSALQVAYDDLRQTQQAVMQQERLRVLGQMASGIAHDINNAISPVAIYTDTLLEKEPNLSARTRKYLETISRAIDDVAHTVARMREFYRQREPQLALVPVNLNQLVEQILDLTRVRWSDMPQQRGVVIQTKVEQGVDLPDIRGVASEIREALINLVFNAVDAMPDGGTLTLRTRLAEPGRDPTAGAVVKRVQVEVADTGVGMSEETKRRCLEPFFTTKGERGTGLGLAMVYGTVQRHNADIEIDSTVNQGTVFRLIFEAVTSPTAADGQLPASAALSRLRILLVDDDPLLLKSLCDALEAEGHLVVTMNGGQAGIDAFRAVHQQAAAFEVVITDLGMPYVDGREVARIIKEMSSTTPVIMLTGWGQRLVAEGEIPPHVDCLLSKPPKLRDLREAIGRCCRPQGPGT